MMLANRAKIATAIISVQSRRLSSRPRDIFRLSATARAIISTVDDGARNPIYHCHVCVVDNAIVVAAAAAAAAASKGEFRLNPNRKVDPLRRVEPRGSRQFTSIIPRQRDETIADRHSASRGSLSVLGGFCDNARMAKGARDTS